MDPDASSQASSDKSRKSHGFRQLSSDAKGFFKDQVAKAKHVRDDLIHKKGEPSTPKHQTPSSEAQSLISPPSTPSSPSPWSPRLPWKALPKPPEANESANYGRNDSYPAFPGPNTLPRQPTPSLSASRPMLHHLSALRIGLTSLVVVHHTAIPYGGLGSWGWRSPGFPTTAPALVAFNAFNQTWFMAGFFWMAGAFTHAQLRKAIQAKPALDKSVTRTNRQGQNLASFITGRTQRLVVPAIAYTLLVAPLLKIMILAHERPSSITLTDIKSVLKGYFGTLRGIRGPVWFSVLLFLFDAAATTVASLSASAFQPRSRRSSPRRRYVFGGFGLAALAAFLVHVPCPVGYVFTPLNLQPAFLPQYAFAYIMGHVCASSGSMYLHSLYPYSRERPLSSFAFSAITMALGLGATCASVVFGKSKHVSLAAGWKLFSGGFSLPAALYAAWDTLGFITILPSIVAICERYFNRPELFTFRLPSALSSKTGERKKLELSRYAYATFLIHPVVSLGIELLTQRLLMPYIDCSQLNKGKSWWALSAPLLATAVVGTMNTVASWAAGIAMVEWVPFVGRWI